MKDSLADLDKQLEEATEKAGGLLRSRFGLWFLALLSFAESALLIPIITDPFMVAYMLFNRTKILLGTIVTIASSVVGGVAAFVTAAYFIDFVLRYLSPEAVGVFNDLIARFAGETFMLAFIGALTPYTLSALAAGTLKGSLIAFIFGSIVGRTIRYGIVAYLTHKFGDQALRLARKHLTIATIITFILLILYIAHKM
jgi:membrane protein YqaA with SNARE-associated domain